jgi:hypothetical protein
MIPQRMNREKEEYRKGKRVVEREVILMKLGFQLWFFIWRVMKILMKNIGVGCNLRVLTV